MGRNIEYLIDVFTKANLLVYYERVRFHTCLSRLTELINKFKVKHTVNSLKFYVSTLQMVMRKIKHIKINPKAILMTYLFYIICIVELRHVFFLLCLLWITLSGES